MEAWQQPDFACTIAAFERQPVVPSNGVFGGAHVMPEIRRLSMSDHHNPMEVFDTSSTLLLQGHHARTARHAAANLQQPENATASPARATASTVLTMPAHFKWCREIQQRSLSQPGARLSRGCRSYLQGTTQKLQCFRKTYTASYTGVTGPPESPGVTGVTGHTQESPDA